MLNRDELIKRYWIDDRTEPRVRMNFVSSLDGAATHQGVSGALGNADDKLVFDTLRVLTDVILVGAGTVRAEGYGGISTTAPDATWRNGQGWSLQPRVAIVSSRLDLDPAHGVFTDSPLRPLIVTHAAAPADRRAALAVVADVLICGETEIDPVAMVLALAVRGMPQILCEGGPHLFGALIEADCVDELCLSLSPVLEGGDAGRIATGGAQASRPMTLVHALPADDMLFLRYARRAS